MLKYDPEFLKLYGVKEIENGSRGGASNAYDIPCSICKKYIRMASFDKQKVYVCQSCRVKSKKKREVKLQDEIDATLLDYVDVRHVRRYEKAIDLLHRNIRDITRYENAIALLEAKRDDFDSVPEALVAIQLIKDKHKISIHPIIQGIKPDFVVVDLRCVVEVDGGIYHTNDEKEALKDYKLHRALGAEWGVVHIPAEYISKNIAKLDFLIKSALQTQKANGFIK